MARKPVIRVGDVVRILNYRPVYRVGYDLGLQDCYEMITPEQVRQVAAVFGVHISPTYETGLTRKMRYHLSPVLYALSNVGAHRQLHFCRVVGGSPFEAHNPGAPVKTDKTGRIALVEGKRTVACGFRYRDEDGSHFEQTSRHVLITTPFGELLATDVELVENDHVQYKTQSSAGTAQGRKLHTA